ncbi:SDR family NAD(P)-dependent oxidoreductase [Rhodococcus sp. IEGM 1307]|uniref:SDR family NAD(P)-dependent oxidoreductase n=1 Tax=Rhodococcus sp. IEGM 1307 TaxID=3047091 RepID=UPI0024B67A0A|nr:SDR family NAD(P)-dependent oxidoreductase [Rhodococcus sp. IEGM 1307]MDI9975776.1 SDR family NAD(P)-dependent oxidoreductase [Rhodococcus sp. IEGM 1307]
MDSIPLNPQTPPARDRLVLVTGVEQPEGAYAARALGTHGFDVIAHSFTSEAAERVAQDITGIGGRATAAVADLTIDGEVDRLFTGIEDTHGRVDTVIHSAWIPGPESTGTSLQSIHPHDWDRFLLAHLRMLFTTVRRATQSMSGRNRAGSIVTVVGVDRLAADTRESTLTRRVIDGAIEAFTAAAAHDISARTVQVNTIRLIDELPSPEFPDQHITPDFDTALVFLADPAHRSWSGKVLSAPTARFADAH